MLTNAANEIQRISNCHMVHFVGLCCKSDNFCRDYFSVGPFICSAYGVQQTKDRFVPRQHRRNTNSSILRTANAAFNSNVMSFVVRGSAPTYCHTTYNSQKQNLGLRFLCKSTRASSRRLMMSRHGTNDPKDVEPHCAIDIEPVYVDCVTRTHF